jgi:hypothetical protein
MANVTLTFAYPHRETGILQYKFVDPLTGYSDSSPDSTIAKIFARVAVDKNAELETFAVELYNSNNASVNVDESRIPDLLSVATNFRDAWQLKILQDIINNNG